VASESGMKMDHDAEPSVYKRRSEKPVLIDSIVGFIDLLGTK
jgi:hypothetical protein